MDQPAHPDPHHTGDCSLINPEECPIVVDRFRQSSSGRKKNSPPAVAEGTTSMTQDEGELASGSRPSVSPLSPSFPPDRRLPLPLPLRARLFIEPALAQFRVKPRALNLSLELTESPFEVFSLLDDHFQRYHAPWVSPPNSRTANLH